MRKYSKLSKNQLITILEDRDRELDILDSIKSILNVQELEETVANLQSELDYTTIEFRDYKDVQAENAAGDDW
jgi:uncharacterized small protein (DUF1192 family)